MIVHVTDLRLVEAMWPVIAPLLAPALEPCREFYQLEDVKADLLSRRQELWVDVDRDNPTTVNAAMTTIFDQYPRCKTIKVVFCGGRKMRSWIAEFKELIEDYGRKNGCKYIEGYWRRGWARVWGGGRETGVGMIKEL